MTWNNSFSEIVSLAALIGPLRSYGLSITGAYNAIKANCCNSISRLHCSRRLSGSTGALGQCVVIALQPDKHSYGRYVRTEQSKWQHNRAI